MAKQLSLRKLEALRYFLTEAIDAGAFEGLTRGGMTLPTAARTTVEALDTRISELKVAAPSASAHMPRTYCMLPGMTRIGCSCGWYPAKAPTRMSQMDTPFRMHRAKLNLPTDNWSGDDVLYADGPYKGMTWDQAYALDKGEQLHTARAR